MFLDLVGAIHTTSLPVSTTAVKACSANILKLERSGRHTVEICNTSAKPVYLGDKNVTISTGLPIAAGASKLIPVNNAAADNLYLIAETAVTVILAEYSR